MPDYVNPKYAALIERLRTAQQDQSPDGQPGPVRGFLIPKDRDSK